MKVCIHQPNYLPYTGLFSKIKQSQAIAFYDDAQYSKGDWHNRTKIRTANGDLILTLPVLGLKSGDTIDSVVFDESVLVKHWRTIEQAYKKYPYFELYGDDIRKLLLYTPFPGELAKFNMFCIIQLCKMLGLETLYNQSSLAAYYGKGDEALVSMLTWWGDEEYLSGPGGRDYIDPAVFEDKKIKLSFQEPVPDFPSKPYSIIDLLFSEGPNAKNFL